MSIGPDIEEALIEVGAAYTIYKPDGTVITGEYLDYNVNRQVTKPFIREFFIEAMLPYNSQATSGDVVMFNVDSRKFLIMNLTPELFENEIISYNVVLYKCNEVATIKRWVKSGWGADYTRQASWSDIVTDVPVLLTERFFGTGLKMLEPKDLLEFDVLDNQLYLSSYYDVKPQDRVWLSATEYYKVDFIESRKFDNVHACVLSEDTRDV